MRKIFLSLLLAGGLLLGMFTLIRTARSQGPDQPGGVQVIASENQGENTRQIDAPTGSTAPQQPEMSFIDSPSPTCYQPDPHRDACFINWYYTSVNASPSSMVAMTYTIGSQVVARVNGFFQTSMYIPYNMVPNGYKVACGAKGAGGKSNLGNLYYWMIQAEDSAKLTSRNYGMAYCPPYVP